jgi:regulator of sigma E protease
MDALIYPLAFIVAVGLLVTVHEFGHYLVARVLGVKVLRFSVGFGRPLWLRRAGADQTEYVIAAIPLGGYVKMLDEREGEVAPAEAHRAFNRQSYPVRTAIVAAGAAFNFAFAILAWWGLYLYGVPGLRPVVGEVRAGSPAALAGVRPGEEIIAINDEATPTLAAVRLALIKAWAAREPARLELEREGVRAQRELVLAHLPEGEGGISLDTTLGILPARPPAILGQVLPDGAAHAAGLQVGDRILTVAGEAVRDWQELAAALARHPEERISLQVQRKARRLEISLTPAVREVQGQRRGYIGVAPDTAGLKTTEQYGVAGALAAALRQTADMSLLTLRMLGRMLTGSASLKNISGPVSIAQYAGESAKAGWLPYVQILALISVSLGVLNLLPVPLLDGGHLLYYALEVLRRKPMSERALEIGNQMGLAVLLALMGLAIYNDLMRLLVS